MTSEPHDRGNQPPRETVRVLAEVHAERGRQDTRWGEQNHPDGTGGHEFETLAEMFRQACESEHQAGNGTWRSILMEETYEALSETAPGRLRAELVQVAAVAVNWIEAIDRRAAHPPPVPTRPCGRCDGCGQLADSDDAEPWSVWLNLPVKSAAAVFLGLVKPKACHECRGTGSGRDTPQPPAAIAARHADGSACSNPELPTTNPRVPSDF